MELGSGVRGVDLIPGNPSALEASEGDAVRVLLKGRLFAKQGWVFTNDYEEGMGKGGLATPHEYVVGTGKVIRGLEIGVVGMREGGVRRVVIPPSVSYQNKTDEPVPREFSNRQRLYSTVFNPTRIANGEGETLSTVVFDIELVRVAKRDAEVARTP
jgi:FKBP-type peptidyl-prolyl cis-trans isomerase